MRELEQYKKILIAEILKIRGGNNVTYDFSGYKTFKELFRDLYYRKMTIDESESKQEYFNAVLVVLNKYTARDQKHIKAKNELLDNIENFYNRREKIIKGFKDGIFLLNYDDVVEEKNITPENGLINYKKFGRLTRLKNRDINDELVRKHFLVQDLVVLLEKMKKLKNNPEKNKIQVNLITTGLKDLKKKLKI